jgi:hypothetical protein
MKNLELSLITFLFSAIFFSACKEDDNTIQIQKTFVVDATSQTKWTYFSFTSADTINIVNPLVSTDWDLAFKGTCIRTNSGKSGIGQGGAFNANLKDESGFSSLSLVPNNAQFTVDDTMKVMVMRGFANDTVNSVLYTWYSYDHTTHYIVPTNSIYIIKTASGKYAKLWIRNYYRDSDLTMGYIKFSYFYRSDGSGSLE